MKALAAPFVFLALTIGAAHAGEAEDLAWAGKRGVALFDYDRAAWVASDALLEDLKEMPRGQPRGWVVTETADGALQVDFVANDGGQDYSFYRARVENRRVAARAFTTPEQQKLTPAQLAMIAARDAAVSAVPPACEARPYNTVVMPNRQIRGANDVYLLTPQLEVDIFPVGGHSRVTVGDDGGLISRHAFLNTCLKAHKKLPDGTETVTYSVSHLNDPLPTEIHVFLSIWMEIPVLVVVNEANRAWLVTAADIDEIPLK